MGKRSQLVILKKGQTKNFICHVNIRSLLADSRLTELEILCANQDIDVLCLSETWLSSSRAKAGANVINIPGFQPPFRCDRLHSRGGGVAVYVRTGLNAVLSDAQSSLESVSLVLHLPGKRKVSILAVYRPPNSDCSSFLSDLDATLSSLKRSASFLTCVVGDFNSKLSTWWSGQSCDAQGVALSTLMCDHDLTHCKSRVQLAFPLQLHLSLTSCSSTTQQLLTTASPCLPLLTTLRLSLTFI